MRVVKLHPLMCLWSYLCGNRQQVCRGHFLCDWYQLGQPGNTHLLCVLLC
jgi:hypothetical protein